MTQLRCCSLFAYLCPQCLPNTVQAGGGLQGEYHCAPVCVLHLPKAHTLAQNLARQGCTCILLNVLEEIPRTN